MDHIYEELFVDNSSDVELVLKLNENTIQIEISDYDYADMCGDSLALDITLTKEQAIDLANKILNNFKE